MLVAKLTNYQKLSNKNNAARIQDHCSECLHGQDKCPGVQAYYRSWYGTTMLPYLIQSKKCYGATYVMHSLEIKAIVLFKDHGAMDQKYDLMRTLRRTRQ